MGNIVTPAQQSKVSKLKSIVKTLTNQQRKIRTARTSEYVTLKRLYTQIQKLTQKKSAHGNRANGDMMQDDIRQVRFV